MYQVHSTEYISILLTTDLTFLEYVRYIALIAWLLTHEEVKELFAIKAWKILWKFVAIAIRWDTEKLASSSE